MIPGIFPLSSSSSSICYADSGCGQCIFNNKDCFVNICPCVVEVVGVGTSVFIYGEGTVHILLTSSNGQEYIGILHNCLQGTGEHDLLSVSQIQATPTTFNLSN